MIRAANELLKGDCWGLGSRCVAEPIFDSVIDSSIPHFIPRQEFDLMASTNSSMTFGERIAPYFWIGLVVTLLGLQVVLGFFALTLATGDPSVAVVPDYYERALHWDETEALKKDSQTFGWNVQFTTAERPTSLTILLRDKEANPIEIETGTVQLYHHARASQVRHHNCEDAADGEITLSDCFVSPGYWEVTLDVKSVDGQRYVQSKTMYIDSLVMAVPAIVGQQGL